LRETDLPCLNDRPHLLPRSKAGGFEVKNAQFFSGCVTRRAFKFTRSLVGSACLDLKPDENVLVVDNEGFLEVIGFGFAKHTPFNETAPRMAKSFVLCSGTPENLSPELVLSKGNGKSTESWALESSSCNQVVHMSR
jgi:hypothetical protein